MSAIRRILGLHGVHRSGVTRPLPAFPAPQDPWAAGEAFHWATDTMLLPTVP
ncbi:hypothetical protein [Verrucosispora sp. NA02020]|uniref:hypothetical protein n=1 Tax=Verrucosispora sp. NA02020 TaxID=2742132 RepID=UPI00158FF9E4|nr:hypothetical protein [Verrucosispora sp. NA02020]QKW15442.1 hypothetical protein HUT12_23520 [Verrucosispora sp. NA02020]